MGIFIKCIMVLHGCKVFLWRGRCRNWYNYFGAVISLLTKSIGKFYSCKFYKPKFVVVLRYCTCHYFFTQSEWHCFLFIASFCIYFIKALLSMGKTKCNISFCLAVLVFWNFDAKQTAATCSIFTKAGAFFRRAVLPLFHFCTGCNRLSLD